MLILGVLLIDLFAITMVGLCKHSWLQATDLYRECSNCINSNLDKLSGCNLSPKAHTFSLSYVLLYYSYTYTAVVIATAIEIAPVIPVLAVTLKLYKNMHIYHIEK